MLKRRRSKNLARSGGGGGSGGSSGKSSGASEGGVGGRFCPSCTGERLPGGGSGQDAMSYDEVAVAQRRKKRKAAKPTKSKSSDETTDKKFDSVCAPNIWRVFRTFEAAKAHVLADCLCHTPGCVRITNMSYDDSPGCGWSPELKQCDFACGCDRSFEFYHISRVSMDD